MLTRIHPERIAAASHVPTAGCDLTHLTNDELTAGTRRLVGASNQMFAMLLAHLAEVEARGIHRERACSSLYTYCIYELRFSEDAAFRRVSAARLVKRFPALYEAIASGELHLTGLLMLGPHLTPENHLEVLGRAKHRTKKELSKLLRALDPLPDLPACIEPLGPAPVRRATMKPSWADFVESLCPVVRELGPGDAPRDWMNDELPEVAGAEQHAAEAGNDGQPPALARPDPSGPALARSESSGPALARSESSGPALARPEATAVTGPLRYGVQFSAEEEYVQLVERAKALLSHAHSKSTLEEIHLRAMRLLVADLEKRRFGRAAQRRGAEQGAGPVRESSESSVSNEPSDPSDPNDPNDPSDPSDPSEPRAARRRGRHIPAAVRREVFERDAARCTFVDSAGRRCREAHCLELHHLRAFAQGGEHLSSNLALRCRAHNALAAEEDFGRDFVEKKRAREHELFGSG
jgi:hypothetical protein